MGDPIPGVSPEPITVPDPVIAPERPATPATPIPDMPPTVEPVGNPAREPNSPTYTPTIKREEAPIVIEPRS